MLSPHGHQHGVAFLFNLPCLESTIMYLHLYVERTFWSVSSLKKVWTLWLTWANLLLLKDTDKLFESSWDNIITLRLASSKHRLVLSFFRNCPHFSVAHLLVWRSGALRTSLFILGTSNEDAVFSTLTMFIAGPIFPSLCQYILLSHTSYIHFIQSKIHTVFFHAITFLVWFISYILIIISNLIDCFPFAKFCPIFRFWGCSHSDAQEYNIDFSPVCVCLLILRYMLIFPRWYSARTLWGNVVNSFAVPSCCSPARLQTVT